MFLDKKDLKDPVDLLEHVVLKENKALLDLV